MSEYLPGYICTYELGTVSFGKISVFQFSEINKEQDKIVLIVIQFLTYTYS